MSYTGQLPIEREERAKLGSQYNMFKAQAAFRDFMGNAIWEEHEDLKGPKDPKAWVPTEDIINLEGNLRPTEDTVISSIGDHVIVKPQVAKPKYVEGYVTRKRRQLLAEHDSVISSVRELLKDAETFDDIISLDKFLQRHDAHIEYEGAFKDASYTICSWKELYFDFYNAKVRVWRNRNRVHLVHTGRLVPSKLAEKEVAHTQ